MFSAETKILFYVRSVLRSLVHIHKSSSFSTFISGEMMIVSGHRKQKKKKRRVVSDVEPKVFPDCFK